MLKKILYNKYKIQNIPEAFDLTSEEFLKILFDNHDACCFEYKKNQMRLHKYNGTIPDSYGRATNYFPVAMAGGEVYRNLTKKDCEIYHENVLRGGGYSSYSFITDDIDNYIEIIKALDEAMQINSKQVYLPFIAKANSGNQATALKNILKKIFGKDFENMVVEYSISQTKDGTVIEPTNMQVFLQQIQDTKKKIIDEAFLYLGVARPTGKLAHESELEVAEASEIPDLIDAVVFDKIQNFIDRINKHWGFNMSIVKRF